TAAAAFLRGDLLAANEPLDAAVAGKRAPSCGHAAPILATLLLERDDPKATAAARRVMSAAADARIGRAFRSFLRHHERRGGDLRGLHVHQLPADASPWELLLTGFTAHFHVTREATRGGWARALVRLGERWTELGYAW